VREYAAEPAAAIRPTCAAASRLRLVGQQTTVHDGLARGSGRPRGVSDFLTVMGLAALPAAANFLGGGLAEVFRVSGRVLSLALHLAAGIVLAVVGLELMPEALQASPPWVPLLAFVAGGAAFIGLDRLIGYVQGRLGGSEEQSGALAIFGGVALDLFSDGVMIGTGTVLNPALGLLLALGQMPADVPEGFAAVATLRSAGVSRKQRLLMTAGFAIPILVGAALGFLALRDAPEVVTLSVLALTGGALVAVVVEEMVTEAHEGDTSRLGPIFLTAGFALFAGSLRVPRGEWVSGCRLCVPKRGQQRPPPSALTPANCSAGVPRRALARDAMSSRRCAARERRRPPRVARRALNPKLLLDAGCAGSRRYASGWRHPRLARWGAIRCEWSRATPGSYGVWLLEGRSRGSAVPATYRYPRTERRTPRS
jgi:zinc transporter, ZIP family